VRGCLGFTLFTIAAVAVLAFGITKWAIPALVAAAVETSPVVHGQAVDVLTDASVTGVFLGGRIDRVRITGTNLSEPSTTIGGLDVVLSGVSILDRTFESASGTIAGASVEIDGSSTPIQIPAVALSGSSSALVATVQLGVPEAEALLRGRITRSVPVDEIRLTADGADLVVHGQVVHARLVVTSDTLTLVPDSPLPSAVILSAPSASAWRIQSVQVDPTGVRIAISISLG
jgi:hypothetical protein